MAFCPARIIQQVCELLLCDGRLASDVMAALGGEDDEELGGDVELCAGCNRHILGTAGATCMM